VALRLGPIKNARVPYLCSRGTSPFGFLKLAFLPANPTARITSMSFEGVTFSLAGLVVLSFAVMRSDWGEVLLGRRLWATVTTFAALSFLGVAFYRPLDFQQGVERVSTIVQRELAEAVDPALARLTTTTTSQPPGAGVVRANP
jgi:hypothetical protein